MGRSAPGQTLSGRHFFKCKTRLRSSPPSEMRKTMRQADRRRAQAQKMALRVLGIGLVCQGATSLRRRAALAVWRLEATAAPLGASVW